MVVSFNNGCFLVTCGGIESAYTRSYRQPTPHFWQSFTPPLRTTKTAPFPPTTTTSVLSVSLVQLHFHNSLGNAASPLGNGHKPDGWVYRHTVHQRSVLTHFIGDPTLVSIQANLQTRNSG
jgi:hypothetical protein